MAETLTVVVPVFNEESTICDVLRKVLNQPTVGQVVVVDDFSSDRTLERLKEIQSDKIDLFQHSRNLGKGSAIRTGIQNARFPITIIQDADLEYSPEYYPQLVKPILDGKADVVFGSRFLGSNERRVVYFWHFVANKMLTLFTNVVTNLNLSDMETCYKVVKTSELKSLNLREKRFGIEPELTIKLAKRGLRFYEVPVSYHGRTYEEGKKIKFKDGVRAIYCIFRYSFSN